MTINGVWRAIDDDVPQEEARVRVSVRWKRKQKKDSSASFIVMS
jgi:hypothetical protein